MQLFEPLSPAPGAPLAAVNPLAKLGAAAAFMLVAFAAVDLLTPSLLLAVEVAAVPAAGLRPSVMARRLWPLAAAALGVAAINALLPGEPRGDSIFALGPIHLTSGSLIDGVALGARLAAIALAGVLAFLTTEPTDLADALIQQLQLSPRVAVASLAGMRTLPLLAEEWQTIGLARRARGVEAGRSPAAAVRLFAGRLLTLLVRAVRRATRMAQAMEIRALGARDCRTVARPQRMERADWRFLGGAVLAAAGANLVSVVLGSWRFLFAAA